MKIKTTITIEVWVLYHQISRYVFCTNWRFLCLAKKLALCAPYIRFCCLTMLIFFKFHMHNFTYYPYTTRHVVAQLSETLCYKPEGRRFNSRRCHWNFSLAHSIQPHYGPGVDSASNRNEHQEYFLGVKVCQCIGLTTLPPSCADYLEIWQHQPPGTLRPLYYAFVNNIFHVFFTNNFLIYFYDILCKGRDLFPDCTPMFLWNS